MTLFVDFTSFLKNVFIERLAEADEFEVVRQVSEYYVDVVCTSPTAFHLNPQNPNSSLNLNLNLNKPNDGRVSRVVEGLSAALLALKRKPVLRVSRQSAMAVAVANELRTVLSDTHRQQFDFRRQDTHPVLLIVDRLADPTSCLLTQWTFQSMLHHCFAIHNNRITFTDEHDQPRDMALQDPFYRDNRYANYGDIGERLQQMVRQYEHAAKTHHRTDPTSIVDMRRFIHDYPEWRRRGDLVGQYVGLACALQRLVDGRDLLGVSELEQSMVMAGDPSSALSVLERLLLLLKADNTNDRLRAALLYTGHYCRRPAFNRHSVLEVVGKHLPAADMRLVEHFIKTLSQQQQPTTTTTDSADSAVKVSDNTVYTCHTSPLTTIVDKLLKGRLPQNDYPLIQTTNDTATATDRPTDVIVFVVNGGSFQEECHLQRLQQRHYPHARIIYGCTQFMNAEHFIDAVRATL